MEDANSHATWDHMFGLKDAALKVRADYERGYGKPCNCATADAALHYGRAQGLEMAPSIIIAAGYAVVPIEPTREMWAAMADTLYGYKNRHHDKVAGDLYRAMLAAAPSPPGPNTEGQS